MKEFLKKIIGINNIKSIKSIVKSPKQKKLLKERTSFYSQFLGDNSLYFDIGANYGNRIEPICDKNIQIIAVEPQKECVKYLKSKYGNRITVLQNGLGDKIETKTMHISNANTLSSFSEEWIDATKKSGRFSKYKWDEKREIEMTTLDFLIETYGNPDFIKVDVEGFELEVLKGLTKPFNTISIEYTVPERLDALVDCLRYINGLSPNASFNYCVSEKMEFDLLKWVGFTEIEQIINSKAFQDTNFGDVYIRYK